MRLACALILLAAGYGQEQPVVRMDVDLLQIDVVVTDSKGNHLADLTADDFAVFEEGKRQRITNFSSIVSGNSADSASTAAEQTATAPAQMLAGRANRTMAVVIDDFGIGQQSFAATQSALRKFIEQVEPRDLVSIVTTSGRLGSLQRLTSDRRLLRAAVDRLRSLPNHRPGVGDDDFTCAWYNHKSSGSAPGAIQDQDVWLAGTKCGVCPDPINPQVELGNDHRSAYYGMLSISALRRVVDGLRELPGRRSILLLTEGLPVIRSQGLGDVNQQVSAAYEAFLDHANRSGVSVNTVDPRGLIASFTTSERGDDPCGSARRAELTLSQQQLLNIARRTGGVSIVDQNGLAESMIHVADDQRQYYLIGFKPSEKSRKFRRLDVRVSRPGAKVRFSSRLYVDEAERKTFEDRTRRLVAAVTSPFSIPNVRLRLASRFWDGGPELGSVIDTTLQVDAHDLTFSIESDGRRKAAFDVLALIYGSASEPLETFEKTYTIVLTEDAYRRALIEGLTQAFQLRVKQAGAYQLRAVVRDKPSERIGSTSEFLELPDLKRGKLALSGIVLSGADTNKRIRFRAGETVFYAYQVLNPGVGPDNLPDLEARATLYHDGRALGSSPPMRVDTKPETDIKRIVVTNDFRLGKLPPGEYQLEVTVVDKNAVKATAIQTSEFEIVE